MAGLLMPELASTQTGLLLIISKPGEVAVFLLIVILRHR
jgi:hypothetical protein